MSKTGDNTIPLTIYLQHDPENEGGLFADAFEVTWCKDQINNNDLVYVLESSVQARVAKLEDALREILDDAREGVCHPYASENQCSSIARITRAALALEVVKP